MRSYVKEVNSRYGALCKRRDELQEELNFTRLTDNAIQEFVDFAQDGFVRKKNVDFRAKRRHLELLQVRVQVENAKFKTVTAPTNTGHPDKKRGGGCSALAFAI